MIPKIWDLGELRDPSTVSHMSHPVHSIQGRKSVCECSTLPQVPVDLPDRMLGAGAMLLIHGLEEKPSKALSVDGVPRAWGVLIARIHLDSVLGPKAQKGRGSPKRWSSLKDNTTSDD